MDVKLIRAFIASPGGLDIERQAAFAAAAEINKSVAQPLGARLELLGWEETLSGNDRPQAIINAEMETCDLFIGVIWTKWGSRPSLGGPYTSGFEEEFELSRDRFARTQAPVMSMYFKQIDPLQLDDPGEDLKKVLEFQEKLREGKAFLYDTFLNADALAAKVRTFLSNHVIRLVTQASKDSDSRQLRTVAGSSSSGEAKTEAEASTEATADQSEFAREEAAFLQQTSKSFETKQGPTAIEVARLRLVAASTKVDGNDHLLIGVHDANLIYESRAQLALSQWEKRSLLTAGLAGLENQNMPLWTWLGELDRNQPALLLALTVLGEDAERIGALKIVRLMHKRLTGQDLIDPAMILRSWFAETRSAAVKVAALNYLKDLGTRDELVAVEQEAARADKDTAEPALAAILSILLRVDERAAVKRLLSSSFEKLPDHVVPQVLGHADALGSDELLTGLDHRSAEVRAAIIDALSARSAIPIETLNRACDDEAPIVRLAALRALDHMGQPLSLDEASEVMGKSRKPSYLFFSNRDSAGEALFELYRRRRLATMPLAPLKTLLGSQHHKHAAYFALAARGIDDYPKRLRDDLRDGFVRYFKGHWPDGIKSAAPTTLLGGLGIGNTDPNELKRTDLVRSALDIIVMRRDTGDLALVRSTIDAPTLAPSGKVVVYLASVGDENDIPRLARTSRFSWPAMLLNEADFELAAKTILKFAKDAINGVIASPIPDAMRAKLISLMPWSEFAALTDDEILALLLADDDQVKRSSARRAAASLPRRRLAKLLKTYRERDGGIYYIITHWLDLGLGVAQRAARAIVTRGDEIESL